MNRQEHLEWCKERALEYVDINDLQQALASMMSDLSKHPETAKMGLTVAGKLNTAHEMREFINGFN